MARLGIISDLHADAHALDDALQQLRRLDVDQTYCLGDTVDYGLFPSETIELLIEHRVAAVRGNHDRWATSGTTDVSCWDLPRRCVDWLRSLPLLIKLDLDGKRVVLAHGRPGDDMRGIHADTVASELMQILDEAKADVLVVGHTHVPTEIRVGERMICNPGSLLRSPAVPMDLPTPGTLGILDVVRMEFTIHLASDGSLVE